MHNPKNIRLTTGLFSGSLVLEIPVKYEAKKKMKNTKDSQNKLFALMT